MCLPSRGHAPCMQHTHSMCLPSRGHAPCMTLMCLPLCHVHAMCGSPLCGMQVQVWMVDGVPGVILQCVAAVAWHACRSPTPRPRTRPPKQSVSSTPSSCRTAASASAFCLCGMTYRCAANDDGRAVACWLGCSMMVGLNHDSRAVACVLLGDGCSTLPVGGCRAVPVAGWPIT